MVGNYNSSGTRLQEWPFHVQVRCMPNTVQALLTVRTSRGFVEQGNRVILGLGMNRISTPFEVKVHVVILVFSSNFERLCKL